LPLTTPKEKFKGVKYDRIGVVLINAVKEQQKIIERQQTQKDALITLVCVISRSADIGREKN
jgi:hypothetical protein